MIVMGGEAELGGREREGGREGGREEGGNRRKSPRLGRVADERLHAVLGRVVPDSDVPVLRPARHHAGPTPAAPQIPSVRGEGGGGGERERERERE